MSCTICPKTNDYCLDPECGLTTGICKPAKVAILYRTDEQPEPEESQEEIFDDLFSQYFKMLHEGNSMSRTEEVLREKFTITRRK